MIFTIGHSNRSIGDFMAMLESFDIQTLVDVRAIPQSRYNPQFSLIDLSATLNEAKIMYVPMKSLGGKREARANSINTAFRSDGFRGYADYMQTEEFAAAIDMLIDLSEQSATAMMCAEADTARCHRALVSDALLARDIAVRHILGVDRFLVHGLTETARVQGRTVSYPAPESAQKSLF